MSDTTLFVTYEAFGAKGDGVTDDVAAIAAAHDYANEHHLPVKANDNATYYIGGRALPAYVRTDTDWGNATFILDDRNPEDPTCPIFILASDSEPFTPDIHAAPKGAATLPFAPGRECLIKLINKDRVIFRRRGPNQNNGVPLTDCFLLSADGRVIDPIIWDFERVSSATAYYTDDEPITVGGGHFRTIANCAASEYVYHARNIEIRRSHATLAQVHHTVTDEGDTGAPYRGFVSVVNTAHVTVRDCVLTGHKIYRKVKADGKTVPMGTYDVNANSASDVRFIGCSQVTDLMDRTRWGIMGSNFCKNLYLDGCSFSRFDAHMGVTNATIKNSTLGWMCLNAIGHGSFLLENSHTFGSALVNLRNDYGSIWDGDFTIRNCTWRPANHHPVIFNANNDSMHDFGYVCTMPHTVTIENLTVEDGDLGEDYEKIHVFAEYDRNPAPDKPFPYVPTKRLCMKNVVSRAGVPIALCPNEALFEGLEIE